MFHKYPGANRLKPIVTIKRLTQENSNLFVRLAGFITGKISDYINGARNAYTLYMNYEGGVDPNAFHHFLMDRYIMAPTDAIKVFEMPFLAPSFVEGQIYKSVVSIGNPLIIEALRLIPRAETMRPGFLGPDTPRIGGGRAFDNVLEAIGMGVLSAEYALHQAFTQQMISTLSIKSIDPQSTSFIGNPFKIHFIHVVKEETQIVLDQIVQSVERNEVVKLDFRQYALRIFLRGFYPESKWSDEWIRSLSQLIQDISNEAFLCIMNPYSNVEVLREDAKRRLDPMIDEIMLQDQSYYLSQAFVAENDPEIIRQIIISLLFAGGDNIKKFMDHVFVEMGSDKFHKLYPNNEIYNEELDLIIKEIGRLYTTIYAQPGVALDDFVIKYRSADRNARFIIRAGTELHYSTWLANRDKAEWGEATDDFNPEAHRALYSKLNPLSTFGSGIRRCRGKDVTLAIIHYALSEVTQQFTWESRVDGLPNRHPTEFNFNNGVAGEITYLFTRKMIHDETMACSSSFSGRRP